jgi:hypothetical protein
LLPASSAIALGVIGAGVGISLILFIVARIMRHDPPRKRFLMRLVQWCATATFCALLFYFFRQQRVYLLSAPILAVVTFLGMLGWLGKLMTVNVRRMRDDEQIRQTQEMRKKYLS